MCPAAPEPRGVLSSGLRRIARVCLGGAGALTSLGVRGLVILARHPQGRAALGRLYGHMRDCYQLNYRDQVLQRYDVHPSVIWGEETLIYGDGNISIGEQSYIGKFSFVLAHPAGVNLTIGKYCAISHGVHIRTEVHKRKAHYRDELNAPLMGADVVTGDYVWIGAHVFIKGGVTIGSNSIIGANSVVTADIPPDTIYGGIPAHLIRQKADYDDRGSA